MPYRERESTRRSQSNDCLTVLDAQRHRLFQQHVTSGIERRRRDFEMGVTRRDDVDEVELGLGEHPAVVGKDSCLRVRFCGRFLRSSGRRHNRDKLGLRIRRD